MIRNYQLWLFAPFLWASHFFFPLLFWQFWQFDKYSVTEFFDCMLPQCEQQVGGYAWCCLWTDRTKEMSLISRMLLKTNYCCCFIVGWIEHFSLRLPSRWMRTPLCSYWSTWRIRTVFVLIKLIFPPFSASLRRSWCSVNLSWQDSFRKDRNVLCWVVFCKLDQDHYWVCLTASLRGTFYMTSYVKGVKKRCIDVINLPIFNIG